MRKHMISNISYIVVNKQVSNNPDKRFLNLCSTGNQNTWLVKPNVFATYILKAHAWEFGDLVSSSSLGNKWLCDLKSCNYSNISSTLCDLFKGPPYLLLWVG